MFKKVILSMMLLCCIVFVVPSVDVKASYDYALSTYYEEPSTLNGSGYVVVYYTNGTYDIIVINARQHASSENAVSVQVGVNNFSLDVLVNASNNESIDKEVFATKYSSSDDLERVVIDSVFNDSYAYYSVSLQNSIKAFIVRGDIYRYRDYVFGGAHPTVTVSWGDDRYMISQLEAIKTAIRQSNSNDSAIVTKLNEIKSEQMETNDYAQQLLSLVYDYYPTFENKLNDVERELEYVNNNLDLLLEEARETNTWLEKIFEWLNESKEEEKQEVQTQGSSSVSQGSDSIENSGQGFGDSMGGLVSSMSYTGTDCSWTFPEVKLPAIKGVMNETVLIEQQPIDFGVWIDAIPSNIMLLIRSVLTGALIIYCFKELYGTISYVLTLKRSGVNE